MIPGVELNKLCAFYGLRHVASIGYEVRPAACVTVFNKKDEMIVCCVSYNATRAIARSQISALREQAVQELTRLESKQSLS